MEFGGMILNDLYEFDEILDFVVCSLRERGIM